MNRQPNTYNVTNENINKPKKILKNNLSIDIHTHLGAWKSRGLNDVSEICTYIGDGLLERRIREIINGKCKCAVLNITGDNAMRVMKQLAD
ncbi:MAG TPA: hypothetical protein QF753_03955 [Victivallales bacterium]|nr:hypothetical protein [Victivallales bacterium]